MAPGSPNTAAGSRFPIPLVGAAVMLVLLILLTPVLIEGGAGAGSLPAHADLVVDHAPNNFTTLFYVRGVGVVRYAEIHIGLNEDYIPNTPGGQVEWPRWDNVTNQISLYVSTEQVSVAVNVSVFYQPNGGTAIWYYGILAVQFNIAQNTLKFTDLGGGLAVPSGAVSITGSHLLPLPIPLAQTTSGPPP
jgi:hypothetical protein